MRKLAEAITAMAIIMATSATIIMVDIIILLAADIIITIASHALIIAHIIRNQGITTITTIIQPQRMVMDFLPK